MTNFNSAPNRHRPWAIAAGAVLALAALSFLVFTQSPWAQDVKPAKPVNESQSSKESPSSTPYIAWTPDHLAVTLSPGDTKNVSATLTAQSAVPSTTVEVVPALAPYLTVNPNSLPALAKGSHQTLQLAFTIPSGTPLGTVDGTVHLRQGSSTVARPLPITLNIWPKVDAEDVRVTYPPTLSIDTEALSLGWAISLNNFESDYLEGGLIPRGGYEIEIVTVSMPNSPLNDIIDLDTKAADHVDPPQNTVVDGFPATSVVYRSVFKPFTLEGAIVYLAHDGNLTKFFLTYYEDDPERSVYAQTFWDLIRSTDFGTTGGSE